MFSLTRYIKFLPLCILHDGATLRGICHSQCVQTVSSGLSTRYLNGCCWQNCKEKQDSIKYMCTLYKMKRCISTYLQKWKLHPKENWNLSKSCIVYQVRLAFRFFVLESMRMRLSSIVPYNNNSRKFMMWPFESWESECYCFNCQ